MIIRCVQIGGTIVQGEYLRACTFWRGDVRYGTVTVFGRLFAGPMVPSVRGRG